ncbi:hypothetical protein E3N88_09025 [Mikania micrantha]|uniref:Uncharacterized protein n=1 Tax=Mikania micrantha TaxID=192012 RepID=A0A5N6PHV6_9ASTR|nr:hypothetical protein E3N88_09025 [Mikania micrantha]
MSSKDNHYINHLIMLVILSDNDTYPSEHSDSSKEDNQMQQVPIPPPPTRMPEDPNDRFFPQGLGHTRATARKTTGLPSRRPLILGGSATANLSIEQADSLRHRLQAEYIHRIEFVEWSNNFRMEFDHWAEKIQEYGSKSKKNDNFETRTGDLLLPELHHVHAVQVNQVLYLSLMSFVCSGFSATGIVRLLRRVTAITAYLFALIPFPPSHPPSPSRHNKKKTCRKRRTQQISSFPNPKSIETEVSPTLQLLAFFCRGRPVVVAKEGFQESSRI